MFKEELIEKMVRRDFDFGGQIYTEEYYKKVLEEAFDAGVASMTPEPGPEPVFVTSARAEVVVHQPLKGKYKVNVRHLARVPTVEEEYMVPVCIRTDVKKLVEIFYQERLDIFEVIVLELAKK